MKALFLLIRFPIFIVGFLILSAMMFLHVLWIAFTLLFVPLVWFALWLPFVTILCAISGNTAGFKKTIQEDVGSYFTGGDGAAIRIIHRHQKRMARFAHWFLSPDVSVSTEGPNQPPQRHAGSRPSSEDLPASETPSSRGPRG